MSEPQEFLHNTLKLIEEQAYYKQFVDDWDAVKQQALEMISGAQTTADCYPAIRMIIEKLGDNHSFFVGADEKDSKGPTGRPHIFGLYILSPENIVSEVFPDSAADQAGIRAGDVITAINGEVPPESDKRFIALDREKPLTLQIRRRGVPDLIDVQLEARQAFSSPIPHGRLIEQGIGYIELFVQGDPNDQTHYVSTGHEVITSILEQGAKGWVVDLRRDRGGNMWPMIAAVGPVLGEGELGVFTEQDGPKERWVYQDGASQYIDRDTGEMHSVTQAPHPISPLNPDVTPVAVLISDLTESSGEMTAIAFLGRPNTRSFGQKTSGLTTAVGMQELEDGSILGIAGSFATDRTGKVYEKAIEPDEQVTIDWARYGLDDDPVIQAAVAWLKTQRD